MKLTDAITISIHNLWSRKGRTLLNLVGVVTSCVMLTMTFAGTRGAREGVFDIMNASEQTKRFMIFESYDRSENVPVEALKVPDGLADDRRARITEKLETSWRSRNAKRIHLDQERMNQLRSIEQVSSIVWQNPVRCQFVWPQNSSIDKAGKAKHPKRTPGSLIGIDPEDQRISGRVVEGKMISDLDDQGVLVDEFTAYNLGYRTDDQLKNLIGVEVEIRCSLGKAAISPAAGLLGGLDAILDSKTIASLKRIAAQLDRIDLSDGEKAAIRDAVKLLPSDESKPKKKSLQSPEQEHPADVSVDSKGNRTLVRHAVVRGILRQPDDDDLFGFLQFTGRSSHANLYMHHNISEKIYSRKDGFKGYLNVAGSVSDVANLRKAVDEVESFGFRTRSAVQIVEKLDREVGKVRLAVGALALLILLVAAVGMCNTMIIAVLERTTEFGIMKSVGAEDRQVLALVLLEGLITGVIGAALAIAVSYGVAEAVSGIARTMIEERLKGSFDQPVFRFHPLDCMIVFAIASVMCVFASLIPAWRAARLNPIAAMKRT